MQAKVCLKTSIKKNYVLLNHPQPLSHILFFFIFTGVTIYVAGDAALNPSHEGKRFQEFKDGTYASYVGSNTAWFEPFVPVVVARFAGPVAGASWLGSSLLPATLAYTTVKGVGWNDWGNHGLNETEMKMNGLWKKE